MLWGMTFEKSLLMFPTPSKKMNTHEFEDFTYRVKVSNPTQDQKYIWFKWCEAHIGAFAWDIDSMVFLKEQDAVKFKEHFGVE